MLHNRPLIDHPVRSRFVLRTLRRTNPRHCPAQPHNRGSSGASRVAEDGGQECSNSRTISRQKLEARVLDRLRRGLMTPAFAAQFAAEVERLMRADRQDDGGHKAQLEARIAKAESAIERLLDRLQGDEAGEALLFRLKTREAEVEVLRTELTQLAEPTELIIPTQADLEVIYRKQVARLEALLTGSDQMVAANALLREMLGEVRVQGDPDARDGVRVELRGEASSLFQAVDGTTKSAPGGAFWSSCQISVVAGIGFEPMTFRL